MRSFGRDRSTKSYYDYDEWSLSTQIKFACLIPLLWIVGHWPRKKHVKEIPYRQADGLAQSIDELDGNWSTTEQILFVCFIPLMLLVGHWPRKKHV